MIKNIGEKIKAHRKARGLTLTQLEEKTGINNGNLSKIERNQQSLTNDTMNSIATAFGISLADLFADSHVETAILAGREILRSSAASRPVTSYLHLKDIPEEVIVVINGIQVIKNEGQNEPRSPCWAMDETQHNAFMGGSLHNLDSRPTDLASVRITDDTMQPRLYSGDYVAVDTSDTDVPDTGGVFAVIIDSRIIAVRRVFQRPGGSLMVVCDNQTYPSMTLSSSETNYITIIGRVKSMRGHAGF